MSGASTEPARVATVRPPSSISLLADRLKCSHLQDPVYDRGQIQPVDHPDTMFMQRARRPKAVNFNSEEICWIDNAISNNPPFSNASSDACSINCDSGNEDSSEGWAHAPQVSVPVSSPSRVRLPIVSGNHRATLQQCLSASAPDVPATPYLSTIDPITWGNAGERKDYCCNYCPDVAEEVSFQRPPTKRPCRSQSLSSHQKLLSGTGPRRNSVARPIALRVPPSILCSAPTTTTTNTSTSALSSTALALIAAGSVKLRNSVATGQRVPASRLSWHHPITCSGGHLFQSNSSCSRHSVICSHTTPDVLGDVTVRKPASRACISPSTSNASDISHHRLSAFTPTVQSQRASLIGDDSDTSFPITASPLSEDVDVSLPAVLSHPTVSAASSGFFQDSYSLSHFCSCSTNSDPQFSHVTGNLMHQCGLINKAIDGKATQLDDSTSSLSVFDRRQHHVCAVEAKLRCQSQPACVAGVAACCCVGGSVASIECLSRQVGMKRRRCSHDVGVAWDCDEASGSGGGGGFLFGSHHYIGTSLDNPLSSETAIETASLNCEAAISPLRMQQQSQTDYAVFQQENETAFLRPCRRKELAGLSEASEEEEEESNEVGLIHRSCYPLEEYDAGTLTPPPPRTRFRPIVPSPSEDNDGDEEVEESHHHHHNHHHHHHSNSTEGSPCSFKANDPNIFMSSEEEEDVVDDEDSFGRIAPCLNHRRRFSPMQIEELAEEVGVSVPPVGMYRELDISMIEQDCTESLAH